jgi:hypothetical protein
MFSARKGEVMKLFICMVLGISLFAISGCTSSTPAYTAKERYAQIHRNLVYESEQFNDEVDRALLLRPSNQDTIWNVYHRD